jgi:hypothetical protein
MGQSEALATYELPPPTRDEIWPAVDRMLDRMDVETVVVHRLGPLAAERWSALGRELPPVVLQERRVAQFLPLLAVAVLQRARAAYPGRMLVVKGPEIAALWPSSGRLYSDLDLLVDDASAAFEALRAAGFETIGRERVHHLAPVAWPGINIPLEIHSRLGWPRHFEPPPREELFDQAIPSRLPVEGLETAGHAHHAVLTAAHAWKHMPLRSVSDLIDITLLAQESNPDEIDRAARRWQVDRIWRTSEATASWVLRGSRRPLVTRLWAQSLRDPRNPTRLERHVRRWVAPFWALPPGRASVAAARNFATAVRPVGTEGWRAKLRRSFSSSPITREPEDDE